MKFFSNLFDGKEKQEKREADVTRQVRKKKKDFEKSMKSIQRQSAQLKRHTIKIAEDSKKLVDLVE